MVFVGFVVVDTLSGVAGRRRGRQLGVYAVPSRGLEFAWWRSLRCGDLYSFSGEMVCVPSPGRVDTLACVSRD